MLEMERGQKRGIKSLVDISRLPELAEIYEDADGWIHIGPAVTHNQVIASSLIQQKGLPLALACWNVGSPQIRNRGTLAGNLVTASPANDTITPLLAMDAVITCRSVTGKREIRLTDFFTGVRKTVLNGTELVTDIAFKGLGTFQHGTFIKLALRKAQAISVINLAAVLDVRDGVIHHAAITLGAVAPTVIHAEKAEKLLAGRRLDADMADVYAAAVEVARPIDDIRSSAKYRQKMAGVICKKAIEAIRESTERHDLPKKPATLCVKHGAQNSEQRYELDDATAITARVNGKSMQLFRGDNWSLLNLLRKNALLTGVKEGCAEGECGACSVILDGAVVMSCLVPAERAMNAEITTIEGVGTESELHPVQQAFIDEGAVQCGYCTPGFIMSAVKLLEEVERPDRETIRQAITGNLCRCTGYYKIISAIEKTGEMQFKQKRQSTEPG